MVKITICPTCGSDKIKKVRRDFTAQSHGRSYKVPNLERYECPNCGEKIYERQAMQKIEAHSPAFIQKPAKKKTA